MRVRVYYNLSRSVWSIKAMEGEHKGRVIGYANSALLRNAHTVVSEASRQRVLREQRKNVHAYIDGELAVTCGYRERLMTPSESNALYHHQSGMSYFFGYEYVSYNPYRVSHFVWEDTGESTKGERLPEVYLRHDRKVQAVPSDAPTWKQEHGAKWEHS